MTTDLIFDKVLLDMRLVENDLIRRTRCFKRDLNEQRV